LLLLILAAGFILEMRWALDLWPWAGTYTDLSSLSSLFLASILAASAVPTLWIALTGETRATEPGALELAVTFLALAIFMAQSHALSPNQRVLTGALVCGIVFITIVAVLLASRRVPPRDVRPTPGFALFSFGLFAVLLIVIGGLMALKTPGIFPWRLTIEMSVVYGWIFLGASVYFIYAVLRPYRYNAVGQLLGFLAYDIVLIVPFIQHLGAVDPALRLNLIVYIAVLLFSGGLAIHYLFINPSTRILRAR
jgi:hypothetical protein